jgi:hypothetical protein
VRRPRYSAEALLADPINDRHLNALGFARCRARRYREALGVLNRSHPKADVRLPNGKE